MIVLIGLIAVVIASGVAGIIATHRGAALQRQRHHSQIEAASHIIDVQRDLFRRAIEGSVWSTDPVSGEQRQPAEGHVLFGRDAPGTEEALDSAFEAAWITPSRDLIAKIDRELGIPDQTDEERLEHLRWHLGSGGILACHIFVGTTVQAEIDKLEARMGIDRTPAPTAIQRRTGYTPGMTAREALSQGRVTANEQRDRPYAKKPNPAWRLERDGSHTQLEQHPVAREYAVGEEKPVAEWIFTGM